MECFERKTYESLFFKEKIEIVRWDKVDSEALTGIFRQEKIRQATESLVNYYDQLSKTDDARKKLGRYLYPGGSFDDMMLFLRCDARAGKYEEIHELLTQHFAQANAYNEPLWVLWGRFLTDVLDVLRQWACCKDKVIERLHYF